MCSGIKFKEILRKCSATIIVIIIVTLINQRIPKRIVQRSNASQRGERKRCDVFAALPFIECCTSSIESVAGTHLKDSSHGINAEPCHVPIEGMPRLAGCRDEGAERSPVEAEYRSGLH